MSTTLSARGLELWVGFSLLVLPLATWTGLRDPFELPKQLLGEVFLLASVLIGLLVSPGVLRWSAAWRALLPIWCVGLLSLLTSQHRAVAMSGFWHLTLGCLAIIVFSSALRRPDRAFQPILLSATAVALLAVAQVLGWVPEVTQWGASEREALTTTVGNVGDLAVFLLLPLLWTQHRLLIALELGDHGVTHRNTTQGGKTRRRPPQWRRLTLWLAATTLFVAVILLTQSLAAVIAAICGSAVLWFRVILRPRYLAAGAVLLAIATLAVLTIEAPRQRAGQKLAQVTGGELNSALSGRLDGWRSAWWMARQRPLVGNGPGTFAVNFLPAKEALLDRGTPFFAEHYDKSSFANAHSEPLEVAAELGAFGVLALAWGLVVVWQQLARRWHHDPHAVFLAAWLVALSVNALFNFPMHRALIAVPALVLFGWVLSEPPPQEPPP